MRKNKNRQVIKEFGDEWAKFKNDNNELTEILANQFKAYTIPLNNFSLPKKVIAADFGAGSGRWDKFFAPMVSHLIIVEPSQNAIAVCKENLRSFTNIEFKNETIEECTIEKDSLDFAISLGVLHHTDNTEIALQKICETLKPGGVLLCYLYYNLENKSKIYRLVWRFSDVVRKIFSRLPAFMKLSLAEIFALIIYLPLARISKMLQKIGGNFESIPLHHYADMPLYMMRNDALDRFGTRIERRYSKEQILNLLLKTGFDTSRVCFSEQEPFWTFAVEKLRKELR